MFNRLQQTALRAAAEPGISLQKIPLTVRLQRPARQSWSAQKISVSWLERLERFEQTRL